MACFKMDTWLRVLFSSWRGFSGIFILGRFGPGWTGCVHPFAMLPSYPDAEGWAQKPWLLPRIMERVHWVNISRLSFPEPWLIPLLYSRVPWICQVIARKGQNLILKIPTRLLVLKVLHSPERLNLVGGPREPGGAAVSVQLYVERGNDPGTSQIPCRRLILI